MNIITSENKAGDTLRLLRILEATADWSYEACSVEKRWVLTRALEDGVGFAGWRSEDILDRRVSSSWGMKERMREACENNDKTSSLKGIELGSNRIS